MYKLPEEPAFEVPNDNYPFKNKIGNHKPKFCRESVGVWVRSIDESYPYFGTTDGKEKDKDER